MKDFSNCIPILLEKKEPFGHDYFEDQRFQILVEAYIDLLTQVHEGKLEKEFEINASAEIFKLFQAISGSIVQRALGESGARAAAVNPDLADLVRREQDASKQLNALRTILSYVLAMSPYLQTPNVVKDLKKKIDSLSAARATLKYEIKRRFPKYANFINPPLLTPFIIQKHLRPGEALIAIYSSVNRTYIWAMPNNGQEKFSIMPFGEKEVVRIVNNLRKSLDPKPETLGDIPEFDLSLAYELYNKLLAPVEEGWKDASELVIVAQGPLGQLPFSVFLTSPFKLAKKEKLLFSNYRKAPWLIRKVSITRQPSVSSFVSIRALPAGDAKRKAFVGFGDPLFNRQQLAQTEKEKVGPTGTLSSNKERVYVRGIRITQTGSLDSEKITTSHIGMLNRLPDTAEEIRSIAHATGADLEQDIFLGKDASEHQVKTMVLADRRIVAFATHALVPGDLDGLSQPAIALCSPTITGENEDGLLTLDEILKLKLNADWVILSACNTGAADGAGAEAASGLGRAFFYAGTRAILVSMWPVETSSARKLTTGLFQYQKEDSKLTRAKVLQKSMIDLIDSPGLKDNDIGKIVTSYAHPLFWATFIIVGESSRDAY